MRLSEIAPELLQAPMPPVRSVQDVTHHVVIGKVLVIQLLGQNSFAGTISETTLRLRMKDGRT
jgi:hypothetical protein